VQAKFSIRSIGLSVGNDQARREGEGEVSRPVTFALCEQLVNFGPVTSEFTRHAIDAQRQSEYG